MSKSTYILNLHNSLCLFLLLAVLGFPTLSFSAPITTQCTPCAWIVSAINQAQAQLDAANIKLKTAIAADEIAFAAYEEAGDRKRRLQGKMNAINYHDYKEIPDSELTSTNLERLNQLRKRHKQAITDEYARQKTYYDAANTTEAIENQIKILTEKITSLKRDLSVCERDLCPPKIIGSTIGSVGGGTTGTTATHPVTIDMTRVTTTCVPHCLSAAENVNAHLDTLASLSKSLYDAKKALSRATSDKEEALDRGERIARQLNGLKGQTDSSSKQRRATLEKRYEQSNKDVAAAAREKIKQREIIGQLEKSIESTKKDIANAKDALKTCEQSHCPPTEMPPVGGSGTGNVQIGGGCKTSLESNPVELGPKSKIGGGMSKVADNLAGKAISKGLGSLFGGGSVGFGGFGGGGKAKNQAPDVQKNPVKKIQPFTIPNTDIVVNVGGMFTDEGRLLISSEIEDAPGKGTYHSVSLHNMDCQRMLPMRYIPYGLYLEWSLSVQYTYTTEHYVDGQLVNRTVEQTNWMEIDSGKELLASGVIGVNGKDARLTEPGIWQQFGFDRATAGINALGALFNIGNEALKQPIAVSINITQPDLDPVMAVPLKLFLYPKDGGIGFVPVDDVVEDIKISHIDPKQLLSKGGGMTKIDPPTIDLSAGDDTLVDSVVDDLQPYRWSDGEGAKEPSIVPAPTDAGDDFMRAFINAFGR